MEGNQARIGRQESRIDGQNRWKNQQVDFDEAIITDVQERSFFAHPPSHPSTCAFPPNDLAGCPGNRSFNFVAFFTVGSLEAIFRFLNDHQPTCLTLRRSFS